MNLRSPCTLSTPLHRLFPSPKSSNSLNFRRRTTSSELQTPVELTGRSGSHSQSVPTHKVTVRDRKRGLVHEFFVPEDQYILHTAESQNISLPFACRHGCCTSCAVRVKSGQIRQPEALGISAELKSKSHQKALRADPSYKPAAECLAIVLTDLGTSLKLAGNTHEGIQKYYEAIKIDPHYAPAYYNLGVVYSEMMQYDMALNCYEMAALERPTYAEAYCNMGVIYKNRGDLESAIACYERCLAVSPNFEIAKNNMAIALTDLGTKVKFEGDINQGVA